MHDVVLAIDPGRTGSATALSTQRGAQGRGIVLATVEWKTVQRKGRRMFELDGLCFGSAHDMVGHLACHWLPKAVPSACGGLAAIGVEGMVIPNVKRGKQSHKGAKSIITLIEETGAVVDAFRALHVDVDYRPTATVWRGRILKLGAYTSRDKAEAYAMDMVDHLFAPGHGLHSIHQVEAACIALYCREAHLTGDL